MVGRTFRASRSGRAPARPRPPPEVPGHALEAGHQVGEGVGPCGPHGRREVRGDLRRADASVAEDFLNHSQTHARFMQVGPVGT